MIRSRLPVVAILAFLSVGASRAWSMAQPLEGSKWKIKLVPDDDSRKAGAKQIEDTVLFKGSKFTSEAFGKQGFAAADYDEDARGLISATFKVEVKSDSAGTAKWSGTVTSTQIKGQLIITGKDGKVTTYDFLGEKLQK